MPKTQDDLIRRALQLLGAVSADEPVSAENSEAVRGMIEPMLDDLRRRAVFDNGVPTEFEGGPFLALATILAGICAPHFGVASDVVSVEMAEAKLRKQQQAAYDSAPVSFLSY